ncbi:MAG: 6-phosphofructokinase [Chloroflexi bacterium]|nr:6-phosphofructokinase [Chloroflexota bacterium]
MSNQAIKSIGVLTSGGDAQGMNAAIRAVVRSAIRLGAEVYAIYEGYQGMVSGGNYIRRMMWDSVGGILQQGGTIIGTARCAEFRTREGRRRAAKNLILNGIDALVIIGGDGSLTGANIIREEWPSLLSELVENGEISSSDAARYPRLSLVGLVGSIDNDMFGTDMTIGADSALHRITEAIDALGSTAASHQRTFVVEVMGRHCGYLALMSAIATGANWVFIPENPPESDNWEEELCETLLTGRGRGRRQSTVIVAEGACDRHGQPITSEYVRQVLEDRLKSEGEDIRTTILGHVQRGGAPSAFDRNLSTILGHAAVHSLFSEAQETEPQVIGIRENDVIRSPLMHCVEKTHSVAEMIEKQQYAEAMRLRGGSFADSVQILNTLMRASAHRNHADHKQLRIAVMHCGAPAPGMNTAVRAAVRLALDEGHTVLGVQNGFTGLIKGDVIEMDWMSVSGWVGRGGAELGTNRHVPEVDQLDAIAAGLDQYDVQALLLIGGWSGYEAAYRLLNHRDAYSAFNIPIICLPASINNNLPGSEYSIGADTALNDIVNYVDKIKQSAVAVRRCFVVEFMGRYCGYLAVMSGLATGAEHVYIHENGLTLKDLSRNIGDLIKRFELNERLGLIIRNEEVDRFYTTEFICSLFEKEGGDLFDVRQAVLGHVQQGGNPSPFDRIQATRMAARCIEYLQQTTDAASQPAVCIGLQSGRLMFTDLAEMPNLVDWQYQRPKSQWWLNRTAIAFEMSIRPSVD